MPSCRLLHELSFLFDLLALVLSCSMTYSLSSLARSHAITDTLSPFCSPTLFTSFPNRNMTPPEAEQHDPVSWAPRARNRTMAQSLKFTAKLRIRKYLVLVPRPTEVLRLT